MSTKVGISYDDEYYLYHECFDNNNFVYLRLDNHEFSSESSPTHSSATLKIGIKTWRKIIEGWNNSEWAKHPEWDNKEEDYDMEGLLKLLESKTK